MLRHLTRAQPENLPGRTTLVNAASPAPAI